MLDLLLIIILIATFIFGWLIMRKVDLFMEECKKGGMCYNETGWGNRSRRKRDGIAKTKPGSAPKSN